jgi:hypothetical protein
MKTNKKKNLPMCGMISLPAGISKRMIKGKKLFYLEKVENGNNRRHGLARIPDRQE